MDLAFLGCLVGNLVQRPIAIVTTFPALGPLTYKRVRVTSQAVFKPVLVLIESLNIYNHVASSENQNLKPSLPSAKETHAQKRTEFQRAALCVQSCKCLYYSS